MKKLIAALIIMLIAAALIPAAPARAGENFVLHDSAARAFFSNTDENIVTEVRVLAGETYQRTPPEFKTAQLEISISLYQYDRTICPTGTECSAPLLLTNGLTLLRAPSPGL